MANPLLALIEAGLTPEQLAGLQGIANMRNAGFQDPEIFGMPSALVQSYATGAAPLRMGVGSGYIPSAVELARITSGDRLGRGQTALALAQFQQQRAVDDAQMGHFNIAQYLDYLARSGASLPLSNPILQRLKPITPTRAPSMPEQYIEDFLTYPREEPGDIGILRKQREELGDERFLAGMRALEAAGAKQYRRGGEFDTDEPIIGIGAHSGRPRMIFGEAGRERVTITPAKLGKKEKQLKPHGKPRGGEYDLAQPWAPTGGDYELPEKQYATGGTFTAGKKSGLRGLPSAAKVKAERAATRPAKLGRAAAMDKAAATLGGIDPNTNLNTSQGYLDKAANVRYTSGGIPGQSQTAGAVAERFRKGSLQTRTSADPLQYKRDAKGLTVTGGSALTPEERQARIDRYNERRGTQPAKLGNGYKLEDVGNGGTAPRTTGPRETRLDTPTRPGQQSGQQSGQGDSYTAAAKLVGEAMRSTSAIVPAEFVDALIRGEVPGISQINARQYRDLNPRIRESLIDLWLKSGLAASEEDVNNAFEQNRAASAF